MHKTFRLLLAASALIFAALWVAQWWKIRALNSGEVHLRPQPPGMPSPPSVPPAEAIGQPGPAGEVASNGADSSSGIRQSQNGISALPAAETFSRNANGGIVVAGSGRFQLYRQGDITYRLDTDSGQACVLFATDAQWRKPLVYDHGCASR